MEQKTQLTIFAASKPGTLADLCSTLSEKEINILGATVSDHVDHALIRFVLDKPAQAIHLLEEEGLYVMEGDVIQLNMGAGPGSLGQIASCLHEAGLNIDYAYASESSGVSSLFLKTDDNQKAMQALSGKGF